MAVRYSFTTPQPKYIVSKLTKIWIFYMIVSVIIVYFGGIYLKTEVNMLNNNAQIVENNMNIQDKKIALINKKRRVLSLLYIIYYLNLSTLYRLS